MSKLTVQPLPSIDLVGREVEVYRNLRAKCYSVRDLATRRVIAHVDAILLHHIAFSVSLRGRARVLSTGRKNVHATIRGVVDSLPLPAELMTHRTRVLADGGTLPRHQHRVLCTLGAGRWSRVGYNPRSNVPGFHRRGDEIVLLTAAAAWLDTEGAVARSALGAGEEQC